MRGNQQSLQHRRSGYAAWIFKPAATGELRIPAAVATLLGGGVNAWLFLLRDMPLILHYDGHAWAPADVPVMAGQPWLTAVACAARGNVWVVGGKRHDDGGVGPFILRFDGSAWSAVEPPATAAPAVLNAVTVLPGGEVYAAGFASSAPGDSGYAIPLVMSTEGGH